MEAPVELPTIFEAQRMDGGVVIVFSDGRSAIYSAALLYSMLHEAAEIEVQELEDEDSADH